MAAIADLVDADRDQAVQASLVEVIGDDALDDPPDRVPGDPQQAGDRGLRHLLREPRDDIFEVARVARPRPRPRDRLELRAAVRAPHAAQLALDEAATRAEIEVTPALVAAVVRVHSPPGLPAARAHPSAPAQPDGHDHPLNAEADVDHRRAGQAQQSVECRGDAHVVLLAGRLTSNSQQPAPGAGGASLRSAQPPKTSRRPRTRPRAGTSPSSARYFTTERRGDPPILPSAEAQLSVRWSNAITSVLSIVWTVYLSLWPAVSSTVGAG